MLFKIGQVTLTRNKDPKSGCGEFFGCLRLVCYQGIEWDRLQPKIENSITHVTSLLSWELHLSSWFLPHCCSVPTVVFDTQLLFPITQLLSIWVRLLLKL